MASSKLACGKSYTQLSDEEQEEYQRIFTGSFNDMIMIEPGNIFVPKKFLEYEEKVYNFKFTPQDVVIMTYSKCGTTWMQEIVWTMLNNPNLDNPDASLQLYTRSPYLESDMLFAGILEAGESDVKRDMLSRFEKLCPGQARRNDLQIQMLEAHPGRRAIKTHLPFSMLSPELLSTCKVVFVARNPKDCVLSFQHHCRMMKGNGFSGTQDTFIDQFIKERVIYGSYATVVKEAWTKRDHPNMHFVFYEDLKADIEGELKKLNTFIETKLTDQQLENVRNQSSFGSMKTRDVLKIESSGLLNEDVVVKDGGFFRKGESGSWKGKFTEEQNNKIDDYVAKHFAGTGLQFKF